MFERSYTINVYSGDKLVNRNMHDRTDDSVDYGEVEMALDWAPFVEEDMVLIIDEHGDETPKLERKRRGNTIIISGRAYEDEDTVPWRVELTEV